MPLKHPVYDPTDFGNRPGDGPFRANSEERKELPGPSDKENLPSTLCSAAERQKDALELVRDLEAGPDRVRAKGQTYLPRSPGEDPANYKSRLERSVFLNAFGQTCSGLAGFVFRRDPVMGEDVPEQILKHTENIDNAGTHLDVFARERLSDALAAGHSGILVDYPKVSGTLSLADEEGLRPYWIPINKDDIISWRTVVEDGRTVLSQLVLRESTTVPDGKFGEKEQVQYRVLTRDPAQDPPVGFTLMEITKDKRVIEVDQGFYRNQDEIPFSEIPTSGRKSLLESTPPLIDLAHLNVAHYQQLSDYIWSIHKTNVPILFGSGFPAEYNDDGTKKPSIIVGANSAIITTSENAKLSYVSHDGAALGESQRSLDDLKRDMAVMGLQMLSPDKQAQDNSTATRARIDKAASDSGLSVTARGLQDAIERCLDFHAKYLNLDDGGSIAINRDFENLTMTPQEITALSALVAQGALSMETMWTILQEGNVLPSDFDADEEKALLSAHEAVNQAIEAVQQSSQPKKKEEEPKKEPPTAMNIEYDEKTGRPMRLVPNRAA